jgi:hypothetical protein
MAVVEIPLAHGCVALIDEADQALVQPFRWRVRRCGTNWYVAASLLMHRWLAGAQPGQCVDHKNGNGLDNRRENLRICTKAENRRNARKARGVSRFKGVCPSGYPGRPWCAQICIHGKSIFLGNYPTEVEAARAYNAAAIELFGEFARLNEIEGLTEAELILAPERNRNPGHRRHTSSLELS